MLLLLLACSGAPDPAPAEPAPAPTEAPAPAETPAPAAAPPAEGPAQTKPAGPTLRVFYSMGDKYQQGAEPEALAAWREGLRADLRSGAGGHYEVLAGNGGGPMGAEWNADADLYVVASTPLPADQITGAALTLGDTATDLAAEIDAGEPTLIAYAVPGAQWDAALEPIAPERWPLLYPPDAIAEHEADPSLGMGVGEMLRLRVEIAGPEGPPSAVQGAFHVARGE